MKIKRFRPLTAKQKAIVDFINHYNQINGYSPSLEEIAREFKLNAVSTVHQHVKIIKEKGYLEKDAFQPRGISPLQHTQEMTEVPLLGMIAAGTPIEPIENPEPIQVPKSMLRSTSNFYALQIFGDSMIEDGIWNGDIILVKQQNTADVGDVVVAITNGEATLKQYGGVINSQIKLIPKNPKLKPFYVDAETFEIRGKFAGLIRHAAY